MLLAYRSRPAPDLSWEYDPYVSPLPGFAAQAKLSAQTVRHHAVDDMQAEAGAALVAAGGKERIKRLPPDVRAHAAAVVAKDDLDIIVAACPRLDGNISLPAVRKCMRDRVEEKVGQHLPVGAGIAADRKALLALDVQRHAVLRQSRP